jgi:tight adherence protein B
VLVAVAPPALLNFVAARRLHKFTSQLPDTLELLSSSLRAGFSFLQGVEAVSQEVEDPMGSELRRVLVEARLGRPMEEALEDCANRMKSPDFDWAVMAVRIQREVGGNLAELLQTVGATMVERERLRRDIKSLTAEGRMSAIVLGCLPPGLGVFFYISQPDYMKPLFNQTVGQILVGVAVLAMLAGFAWMRKIIQIEV